MQSKRRRMDQEYLLTNSYEEQLQLIQKSSDPDATETTMKKSRPVKAPAAPVPQYNHKSTKCRYKPEKQESPKGLVPPLMMPQMDNEHQSQASMLMSWYMAGYHTGYHQAMKKFNVEASKE